MLVSSAAGRLATAPSVELFCQETQLSLQVLSYFAKNLNSLFVCLFVCTFCSVVSTDRRYCIALHCIALYVCVCVHSGRHCCHESFFVARVGCMPSWKL